MSVLNLDKLLQPRSIALIGASQRTGSVGQVVLDNLRAAGFGGAIYPVNPKHRDIGGLAAYASVESLPEAPDLAVVCTPAATVPDIVDALGKRGSRAAVILSAGFHSEPPPLLDRLLQAAGRHGLRILGPNCVGLLVPGIHLNASFAHTDSLPGSLAFISQSGALTTTVLDWAKSRGIGFSHFISLGDGLDVDFGDLIDYLGDSPATRAILLYIESLSDARKFLSAARTVARRLPVIAIKSGRFAEGARAAASHTGALAGNDAVFDAALQRAGLLRVQTVAELFEAVETLAHTPKIRGPRLAIVTNGGGPGVLAVDALVEAGGTPASLDAASIEALDRCLPSIWSRGNPIDIIGDANAERYAKVLDILMRDPGLDAVLVLLVPTAVVDNREVALAVTRIARENPHGKTVLTCWMGQQAVAAARGVFAEAGIAAYETPESAIRAFMHMVAYTRNQEQLLETPNRTAEQAPDQARAEAALNAAERAGRKLLTEPEAKSLLAAYHIPVVATRIARDADQAALLAEELGYPVALKILSGDITHKTEVGGVVLDLTDARRLREAAAGMLERVQTLRPQARVQGFTVQRMARRSGAQELILGASIDPIFGPCILFGHGGTAVEVIRDTAIGLPPLNAALARHVIERTRVARLLRGYRDHPPARLEAVEQALVQLARLITDHRQIAELDINPLLADSEGVIALDARVRLLDEKLEAYARPAIRPYPDELEEWVTLATGERVQLRPIRPEDEPAHRELLDRTDPVDRRFRFFRSVNYMTHLQLAPFTQIDYEREMAFIATQSLDGAAVTLGVVRAVADANNDEAEFAVLVRSDLKRRGIGRLLLDKLIRYQKSRGTRRLVGHVLADNTAMLSLAASLGFDSEFHPADNTFQVSMKLNT
jgi:acetyltransferase